MAQAFLSFILGRSRSYRYGSLYRQQLSALSSSWTDTGEGPGLELKVEKEIF